MRIVALAPWIVLIGLAAGISVGLAVARKMSEDPKDREVPRAPVPAAA